LGDLPGYGGHEQSVVVLREEDVVASGEHHPPLRNSCGEECSQILRGFELQEARGALFDAETVAPAQAYLVKFSDHDAQSYE
jgi:hypothetical protein